MMHKRWIVVRDANDWENQFPVMGIAEVHACDPIPTVILGTRVNFNPWIMTCQGLNDSDDRSLPDPIGNFGYLHTWPAAKPVYKPNRRFQWIADEITEPEYGTHIAFGTFPVLPFYTPVELAQLDDPKLLNVPGSRKWVVESGDHSDPQFLIGKRPDYLNIVCAGSGDE